MMSRTLRSALSCALVLCAASLAACSDSPTEGLREETPDALVDAANRNAGTGARVFQVGRDEQRSATVQPRALRPGTGARMYIEYDCNTRYRLDVIDDPCNDPCSYYPYCGGVDPVDPVDPTPPPPPPPSGVYATFTQGSDASAISNIVANGTILKTLTLSSFSQAIQNVSFTTLDASFRNVGGQSSCYLTAGQFDSSHSSGSGSPLYLSASRTPAWQGVIKWEVVGTHSYTPISGATGGGTVYTSDSTCG